SPFLEPFFLAYHAAPLNALRRKHGLPPFRNFAEGFTFGDFTLYADLPSLVPVTGLPPHHHFLGPIVWSPETPLPSWWGAVDSSRPLIYVSLGTTGDASCLRT